MIIKIMNENGLYSKGGYDVSFSKKGKTWSSLGYLRNHLNQLNDDIIQKKYNNSIIIMVDDNNDFKKNEIEFKEFYIDYKKELDEKNKNKMHELLIQKRKNLLQELKNIDLKKEYCLKEIEKLNKQLD